METFFPSQKWNTLRSIEKLYNDSNGGINGMLNLFVLLFADDTVIMAEKNEHDMQRNLDLLNEYCICNKLKVNIRKTKIMVFARSKTRIRNTHIAWDERMLNSWLDDVNISKIYFKFSSRDTESLDHVDQTS